MISLLNQFWVLEITIIMVYPHSNRKINEQNHILIWSSKICILLLCHLSFLINAIIAGTYITIFYFCNFCLCIILNLGNILFHERAWINDCSIFFFNVLQDYWYVFIHNYSFLRFWGFSHNLICLENWRLYLDNDKFRKPR